MCPSSRKGWARSSRAAGSASHVLLPVARVRRTLICLFRGALLDSPVPLHWARFQTPLRLVITHTPHRLLQRPICLYSIRTTLWFLWKGKWNTRSLKKTVVNLENMLRGHSVLLLWLLDACMYRCPDHFIWNSHTLIKGRVVKGKFEVNWIILC